MPEIWLPYGEVEVLLNLQAESLNSIIEKKPKEASSGLSETFQINQGASIYLLDDCSTTYEFISALKEKINNSDVRVYSENANTASQKTGIQREKFSEIKKIGEVKENELRLSNELANCIFVSTVRPDPIVGFLDPFTEAYLKLVGNSEKDVFSLFLQSEEGREIDVYDEIRERMKKVSASYLAVIPEGGKPSEFLTNWEKKNLAEKLAVSTEKVRGLISCVGGNGYDSDLTKTIRYAFNSVACLKEGGTVSIVSECTSGLGSRAVEMLITNENAFKNYREYVQGIESVYLLRKLKNNFSIILLSSLPEVYVRKRLGLQTAGSTKELTDRMLTKLQKSKISVVVRSAETLVSSV